MFCVSALVKQFQRKHSTYRYRTA